MGRVQTIFHGCCRVGECHQQIQLGKNHLKIKDISCLSRTPLYRHHLNTDTSLFYGQFLLTLARALILS